MDLPPFALDQWMAEHVFRTPPIRYNLAASTGPRWTLAELQALPHGDLELGSIPIGYAPAEGRRELRESIAEIYGIDPQWVVVTTGASEAVSIMFCLASQPDANVVLPAPAFPAWAAIAKAWGLTANEYSLPREAGYRQSADLVDAAVDQRTVLGLVNTPHNPSGALFPLTEIEALARSLKRRRIPLIVDEVYHPLYFGEAQASAAGLENVIVVSDMSKALSLAGLRIGWIIDADAERRKRIINARNHFTISGSPLTEALAIHALRNRDVLLARLTSVASANLKALTELMESVPDILSWIPPKGGTIAFPWFTDGRESRLFCETLADSGVLVAPGDCFGAPEHIRIGFGTQVDGFGAAIAILRDSLLASSEDNLEAAQ